jgi:flavin-dependent dehydrogenase
MREVQYLIIGGGLAGAVFGYHLLNNNIKDVLIIEKDNLPKDKLCGGIISKKSQIELSHILDEKELEEIFIKSYNTVTVNAFKNIQIDNTDIKIVKRFDLDNYIINKYIKLNGNYMKDELVSIDEVENIAILKSNTKIKYKYLIAADGANSKVRKLLDQSYNNSNCKMFSYEGITNESNIKDIYRNKLIISFENFKNGFGWLIARDNDVLIGMGNISGNTNIKDEYKNYLNKMLIDPNINFKGAFLPNGKKIKLKENNIFFIGDASGIISPISGEGIYYALKSSYILQQCIVQNEIDSYPLRIKQIKRRIKKELFLSKFIYNKNIQKIVFSLSNYKMFMHGINMIMKRYIIN